jgi:hypothetical protein
MILLICADKRSRSYNNNQEPGAHRAPLQFVSGDHADGKGVTGPMKIENRLVINEHCPWKIDKSADLPRTGFITH